MGYQLLAELTLILHLSFIVFAIFGGLLCLHHLRWVWLHLPTVAWGIWIELSGRICPLTPLENHFRHLASEGGYQGDFIAHYLLPLIYPQGLTRGAQWVLGTLLLAINVCIYLYVIRRHKISSQPVDE
jgi:hypothetical protein